jgi:hypothetical protein
MIDTLRGEIIPKLEGEFVRGQAFGVIYMLESLKLRTSWSTAFLTEQLSALRELSLALQAIPGLPRNAPRPEISPEFPHDAGDMERLRDQGDEAVSALIIWLGAHKSSLAPAITDAADTAIKTYIHRQLKHELKVSARPMFAEISLGKEQEH